MSSRARGRGRGSVLAGDLIISGESENGNAEASQGSSPGSGLPSAAADEAACEPEAFGEEPVSTYSSSSSGAASATAASVGALSYNARRTGWCWCGDVAVGVWGCGILLSPARRAFAKGDGGTAPGRVFSRVDAQHSLVLDFFSC